MNLTELFCDVDDFVQLKQNNYFRSNKLSDSEIMAIIITYRQSGYKNFKTFYRQYVIPLLIQH